MNIFKRRKVKEEAIDDTRDERGYLKEPIITIKRGNYKLRTFCTCGKRIRKSIDIAGVNYDLDHDVCWHCGQSSKFFVKKSCRDVYKESDYGYSTPMKYIPNHHMVNKEFIEYEYSDHEYKS